MFISLAVFPCFFCSLGLHPISGNNGAGINNQVHRSLCHILIWFVLKTVAAIQLMSFKLFCFAFICILSASSQAGASSDFSEIIQAFKPVSNNVYKTVVGSDKWSSAKISSIEQMKLMVRREFLKITHVCYRRFQKCANQLSAAFCASPTKNITFYIWARKFAEDIMNGYGEGENSNIKCSQELVQKMVGTANSTQKKKRQRFIDLMNMPW